MSLLFGVCFVFAEWSFGELEWSVWILLLVFGACERLLLGLGVVKTCDDVHCCWYWCCYCYGLKEIISFRLLLSLLLLWIVAIRIVVVIACIVINDDYFNLQHKNIIHKQETYLIWCIWRIEMKIEQKQIIGNGQDWRVSVVWVLWWFGPIVEIIQL